MRLLKLKFSLKNHNMYLTRATLRLLFLVARKRNLCEHAGQASPLINFDLGA